MIEKSFFGLDNWKLFQTKEISSKDLFSAKKDLIIRENQRGYVVLFIEQQISTDTVAIQCYKKHATTILKSILIGKFPIPIYSKFQKERSN